MKLRDIKFSKVLSASGVQGFFGEGYWFHKILKPFGLNFSNTTFVAKTATLLPRKGNMTLTKRFTPRNPFPRCIRVKFKRELVLNSVGLSNPGLEALINTGKWQRMTNPFFISLMSLESTPERRLTEMKNMIEMLTSHKKSFLAPFGLQINMSCPNTEHDPYTLIQESAQILEIASQLAVPLMPKYSIASAPIKAIKELDGNPHCDAICVSNTLPFGWEGIDWQKVWGSNTSPLAHIGGGGLSGKTLRPLVCEWIARLRDTGFTKPINGGGGILCVNDVFSYRAVDASSIFLGSVANLRPWRVKAIVTQANSLRWN